MYSRHIIINFSSLSYLGWGVLCCVVVYTYMYVPVCYYRLKLLRNDRLHHCWNPLGCWMIIMNFLSLYINMSVSFVNAFQCRIYDQSFSFIQFFSGSDLFIWFIDVSWSSKTSQISGYNFIMSDLAHCKGTMQVSLST